VNRSDTAFVPPTSYPVPVRLLDSTEESGIFPASWRPGPSAHDAWGDFYRLFPGSVGIATLSRIGFDKTATSAFLHYRLNCGFLCMEGYWVVLRREGGGWRVVRAHMWVVS
jgi:hypothetical protein